MSRQKQRDDQAEIAHRRDCTILHPVLLSSMHQTSESILSFPLVSWIFEPQIHILHLFNILPVNVDVSFANRAVFLEPSLHVQILGQRVPVDESRRRQHVCGAKILAEESVCCPSHCLRCWPHEWWSSAQHNFMYELLYGGLYWRLKRKYTYSYCMQRWLRLISRWTCLRRSRSPYALVPGVIAVAIVAFFSIYHLDFR